MTQQVWTQKEFSVQTNLSGPQTAAFKMTMKLKQHIPEKVSWVSWVSDLGLHEGFKSKLTLLQLF